MFFLFPYVAENAPAPLFPQLTPQKTLPALHASSAEHVLADASFEEAIATFAQAALDLLRRVLASFSSSLTALSNRANVLFTQIAAALALERAMRDAASLFGARPSSFQQYSSAFPCHVGAWPFHTQSLMALSPLTAWMPNNAALNPWSFFNQALESWAALWSFAAPFTPERRPASYMPSERIPFTTTFSFPGFSWGCSFG